MTEKEAREILDLMINLDHKKPVPNRDLVIEAIQMAIKALKAQEQLANNSPELANNFGDLISRKAAIEALMEFDKKLRKINWYQYPYIEHECRGVDKAIVKIANLPSAQPEWNNHTVACMLAELFDDACACNYNGIDEWLPEKCELLDSCPNPVGVACWEQYLKHRAERRTDEGD